MSSGSISYLLVLDRNSFNSGFIEYFTIKKNFELELKPMKANAFFSVYIIKRKNFLFLAFILKTLDFKNLLFDFILTILVYVRKSFGF